MCQRQMLFFTCCSSRARYAKYSISRWSHIITLLSINKPRSGCQALDLDLVYVCSVHHNSQRTQPTFSWPRGVVNLYYKNTNRSSSTTILSGLTRLGCRYCSTCSLKLAAESQLLCCHLEERSENIWCKTITDESRRNMSTKVSENESTGIKQFNGRFLDSAARGDLQELEGLLRAVDIDVKSERGWTALMFAARNGQADAIKLLIEKGCDVTRLNASGQSALDIANFWNHPEAASVLSQHRQGLEFNQIHNYYSLNPLYRASDVRKDTEALRKHLQNNTTKFVIFSNQEPFLVRSEEGKKKFSFAVFDSSQIPFSVLEQGVVVFLGLETWDPESSAWFAVDLGDKASSVAALKELYPKGDFVPPFPVTMQMEPTHSGIFAEAHSLLCWLNKYKYCATCGSKTDITEGGHKRVCQNVECSSRKGIQNTCYPRVDPSLIMLVVSPNNKQCLLGRQKRFPPKMYSCLAGFMEPGECIEDTCRREVQEESGVKIGRVDYHSSQPWPFPASLMLGCIAHARTEALQIDRDELEEARWFSRAELTQMLAGQHPDGLFVPPAEAIAHQLIKHWITTGSANL